ncbi:hypothetical protein, partial [Clostridium perfringens]
ERRGKFKDPRVREAIGLCFDFEWSNKNLMYGAYRRTASFFENSDLKAKGAPSADELKLLEPLREKLPAEVFGEPAWDLLLAMFVAEGEQRVLHLAEAVEAAGIRLPVAR